MQDSLNQSLVICANDGTELGTWPDVAAHLEHYHDMVFSSWHCPEIRAAAKVTFGPNVLNLLFAWLLSSHPSNPLSESGIRVQSPRPMKSIARASKLKVLIEYHTEGRNVKDSYFFSAVADVAYDQISAELASYTKLEKAEKEEKGNV